MEDQSNYKFSRRSLIKALAAVPVVGLVGWGATEKAKQIKEKRAVAEGIYNKLGFNFNVPQFNGPKRTNDNLVRIGIVGNGIRGKMLLEALGFIHPTQLESWKQAEEKNPKDTRYSDFMNQDVLNIEVVAVCDLYEEYLQMGAEAASNKKRLTAKEFVGTPITAKKYKRYNELLADPNVDAVIIATSDNWHAPIAEEAAKAKKHVYLEKPFSLELPDVYTLKKAVEENGVVFQLGHQGRQTESYIKAKEIIDQGLVGKIHRIETYTNRNDANGAWVYDIPKKANRSTVDFEQWQENTRKVPFSLERFFRWRCWWEYGTGLSGDLFTHEYDAVNQILGVGIPDRCMSTGGIYKYKDGRTVPDVLTIACEYPEEDLSFVYNATLANGSLRNKTFMGTEATLELSAQVKLFPDYASSLYAEQLKNGTFKYDEPMYTYLSGGGNTNSIDAVTSATAKYFAARGLLFTYRGGKKVDTTTLHLREWLDCICSDRNIQPSCNLDQAYEEGITALMGNMSFVENRIMYWDKDKQIITRS